MGFMGYRYRMTMNMALLAIIRGVLLNGDPCGMPFFWICTEERVVNYPDTK